MAWPSWELRRPWQQPFAAAIAAVVPVSWLEFEVPVVVVEPVEAAAVVVAAADPEAAAVEPASVLLAVAGGQLVVPTVASEAPFEVEPVVVRELLAAREPFEAASSVDLA